VAPPRARDPDRLMPARVILLLGLLAALLPAAETAAQDDRQKLLEENLSLKIKNTSLETDVLTLQDRLNRITADRDRALTDGERVQAELAAIRTKMTDAEARIAALERQLAAAHASAQQGDQTLRDNVVQEQEAAKKLAEQLADTQAKLAAAAAVPPPVPKPEPSESSPAKTSAAAQGLASALGAVVAAYRADRPAAASKAKLLHVAGATLSEAEIEQVLAGLIEKKAISSWTKYGSEIAGLSYLVVTKVANNRFIGVINLSFEKLLNGQPGALSDVEALEQFFPVEIRSQDNWDVSRVSWLYADGEFLGALPHVAALRTPWTIADYLRARTPPGQPPATILASGGKAESVRPISLADLEKKSPEQFVRLAAAADPAGYPKIHAVMHMNSITLDPAVLTRGVNFQEFEGLRAGVEAAFAASLARASRTKGVADALYGRMAALILMPDFRLETVAALSDGAHIAASYADAVGRRQPASLDFRKEAAGERWLPAAIQR
jgi:hypothetical protein